MVLQRKKRHICQMFSFSTQIFSSVYYNQSIRVPVFRYPNFVFRVTGFPFPDIRVSSFGYLNFEFLVLVFRLSFTLVSGTGLYIFEYPSLQPGYPDINFFDFSFPNIYYITRNAHLSLYWLSVPTWSCLFIWF